MAIQNRRGMFVQFDATKLLPGELAAALDEKKLFICFSPGDAERILCESDKQELLDEISTISENIGGLAMFGIDESRYFVVEVLDSADNFVFSMNEEGRLEVSY